MTLAMVLLAMNGAAAQVASTEGLWAKARLTAVLAYLFTKEIVGFAALLPSASRSFLLYSSLPSHPLSHLLATTASCTPSTTTVDNIVARTTSAAASKHRRLRNLRWWVDGFNASIARDIRYGSAKRNLLDVYVPEAAAAEQRPWPVVMFVHGGIWASGNKELFSHVGACLANYGVVAVVIQYTLFPQVLAWEQVREVSRALTWVLDNAAHYGGDPSRVSLMGHSAGAHLAALVVWERFKACQQLRQRRAAAAADDRGAAADQAINGQQFSELEYREEDLDESDTRQPGNFVGLAGVYDIVQHLKYEQKRGVDTMSCMTPAMGGKHLLEAMSPVRLFHSVIGKMQGMSKSTRAGAGGDACSCDCCSDHQSRRGVTEGDAPAAGMVASTRCCNSEEAGIDRGRISARCSSSEFPRCTLLCSDSDTVVPPDTSVALHAVLEGQLGLQSELVVFDTLRHSDFVLLDGRLPELVSLRSHILRTLQG